MAIPGYQDLMLPLLELGAQRALPAREAVDLMADRFKLTDEERESLLPSGKQTFIFNRTNWALTYLAKAGLISRPRRGWFEATDEGRRLLTSPPARIDVAYLQRFDAVRAFTRPSDPASRPSAGVAGPLPTEPAEESDTPDERIDEAVQTLSAELRAELMSLILARDPDAFEQLIVDLMVAMGYGGGGDNRRIGRSGDGGVDGIINEDRLGLDRVYLQAKRYAPETTVGPNQIREFAGALMLRNADKGVFVTTSSFTRGAAEEAERMRQRIVLIDGARLTELMARHDVGVRLKRAVHIKEIDLNYFEDD